MFRGGAEGACPATAHSDLRWDNHRAAVFRYRDFVGRRRTTELGSFARPGPSPVSFSWCILSTAIPASRWPNLLDVLRITKQVAGGGVAQQACSPMAISAGWGPAKITNGRQTDCSIATPRGEAPVGKSSRGRRPTAINPARGPISARPAREPCGNSGRAIVSDRERSRQGAGTIFATSAKAEGV